MAKDTNFRTAFEEFAMFVEFALVGCHIILSSSRDNEKAIYTVVE